MKYRLPLSIIISLLFCRFLLAQQGKLDLTFGVNGSIRMDINNSIDVINSVKVQPDGKILVAGYTNALLSQDLCMVRFNADGSLDNGFGINGVVVSKLGLSSAASDIQILADGKICVAGYTYDGIVTAFLIARYLPNGSLDMSFGSSGSATTTLGSSKAAVFKTKIQNDGKILLTGYASSGIASNDQIALARYTANGILDVTFGTNGFVKIFPEPLTTSRAWAIEVDTSGKIIVGGYSGLKMVVMKFNSNGTKDVGFGNNGVVVINPANVGDAVLMDLAILSDGSIIGGGYSGAGNVNQTLIKLTPNGFLDNTFNQNGISVNSLSPYEDYISAIELLPNDHLLVSGQIFHNSVLRFVVAKYNTLGQLDSSFGLGGFVILNVDSARSINTAMATQPDGKIIVAGVAGIVKEDIAVLRIHHSPVTGLTDHNILDNILVYPNPSSGEIKIKVNDAFEKVTVSLFNNAGDLVFQIKNYTLSERELKILNLNELPDGLYFLHLSSNSYTKSHKILIDR